MSATTCASCRASRSRPWPPSPPRRSCSWRAGRRLPRIADLQDIVDDLEAELLRPISVEDRRWRLLAHSAQPDETDAVRRSSILTRETAPAVAAWLEGLGLQRARDLVDLPENAALGMTQRVVLPIRHGDVLLGFLWVIVGDQPLTDADRAAIARGGAEVADNLWGRLREADERRTRINALLAQAFSGEPVAADLAATLRWPETGSFAVAVSGGGDEIPERLRRRRGAADFAWLAQDDRVVILARDPAPSLGDELATAGARGGLSARFGRLADIPDAIRQADVAAVCAKARPDEAAVPAYDQLGSWALIATLWMAAGRPLPPHPINELLMHRRGDQLLDALEGLLEHGGDVAAAAKALHLHRATLYRRIQRIEAITGLDFHRGEDRLSAHLALRLLRLYSATHQRLSR